MKFHLPFKTSVLLVTGMATVTALFATDPSSSWNHAGQVRTHSCTPLKYSLVPLRFPDGTTTGFYANGGDPSKNGSSPDCAAGQTEIDAQEILFNNAGWDLYFRPGGGPDLYNDPGNNGQYGHIWVAELNARPSLQPSNLNGQGCAASTTPGTDFSYYIMPTSIPGDLYYKPPVTVGGFPSWSTYGNPGWDNTGGRGDWTYIVWSCVQNGSSSSYPANSVGGGGLVRALGKRDKVFHRCDVSSIHGTSYGTNNAVNGGVTSIYGKTRGDTAGSWIYGWLIHSYQRSGGPLVPCVRPYP
jgi:hypothetical protein